MNGLNVKMWNMNGTITSPWYKTEFRRDYYRKDIDYHIVLEFPKDIRDYKGSLDIELEVDLREKEGWQEELKYAFSKGGPDSGYTWVDFGHAFKLHSGYTRKTWPEAEAECLKEGGHLASVESDKMNKEIQNISWKAGFIWLGGKSLPGAWSWSDNSTWGYTNWEEGQGSNTEELCTMMYGADGTWATQPCSVHYSFICQLDSPVMRGTDKATQSIRMTNSNSPVSMFGTNTRLPRSSCWTTGRKRE